LAGAWSGPSSPLLGVVDATFQGKVPANAWKAWNRWEVAGAGMTDRRSDWPITLAIP
jgi:hypothetical protein